MLDPDVETFVLGALPPLPARVLEVGAGDGALADALRSAGYDVVAIDPSSDRPDTQPVALAALDAAPGSFDAAVAVVSLHHVEPLRASCRRLSELVQPGGTLVFDEFDVEQLDERAAAWWLARRADSDGDTPTPAEVVAHLREHCHSLRTLCETLTEWFALGEPVSGAYLYRWARAPELRQNELQLIASGELPATGARIVGMRKPVSP